MKPLSEKVIKVTKKYRGLYNVFNAKTKELLGHIENGYESGATDRREWIAYDKDGEWIGTTSTKKQLMGSFEDMVLNPELYK